MKICLCCHWKNSIKMKYYYAFIRIHDIKTTSNAVFWQNEKNWTLNCHWLGMKSDIASLENHLAVSYTVNHILYESEI